MKNSRGFSRFRVAQLTLAAALVITLTGARAQAGIATDFVCGNEILEPGEECEDGGQQNGDCCSSTCQFEAAGSSCADEDFCSGAETCNGAGACQPGTPIVCDDGDPCTTDFCNGLAMNCGTIDNNAACDDEDPCTVGDQCSDGICQPGSAPLACNDNNECTDDVCIAMVGCQNSANTGPCNDSNVCTTSSSCSDGVCIGSAPINCDDNDSCTADTCDPASGCFHNTTVESQVCDSCEDGTDNDADNDIDAEDVGCATLAKEQRFAVISTRTTGRRALYSGSDVLVDSAGGNQNLPYPLGQSRAGMCGYNLDIRAGNSVGIMAVDTQVTFGQGTTVDRDIDAREEFVSDSVTVKIKSLAPLVGVGACSNNAMLSCIEDLDCGAGSCDGRLRLDATNPVNPFVDMSGNADNFVRCQDAIADLQPASDAVAQLPAVDVGTLLGNSTNDIRTTGINTLVQLTVGGGLQVLKARSVRLGPAGELRISGQPDTVLVMRVSRKLRLGAGAKVTLLGGLTADHVLWNIEGPTGGRPDFAGLSQFSGTVLAPGRQKIRTGAAAQIDGALFSKKIHLGADTIVTHVPFTPLVP